MVGFSLGVANNESKRIDMTLLLAEKKTTDDLSTSLMAAFHEVGTFYNKMEKLAEFHYHYISKFEPENLPQDFSYINYDVKSLLKEAEDFIQTYNASRVRSLVECLLSKQHVLGSLLIVTDNMLTPPSNWRYIIWSDGVVSIAPLDPYYWTTMYPRSAVTTIVRINAIKHRVRTACMSIVGSIIGLKRCEDEQCFLFNNVDSFMRLDKMVKLVDGHNIKYLKDLGFDAFSENPENTSKIIENPKWRATS